MRPSQVRYKRLLRAEILAIRTISATDPSFPRLENEQAVAGLFLETDQPLAAGMYAEFEFQIPSVPAVYQGRGRVVWQMNCATTECPKGMGLQVLEVLKLDAPPSGPGKTLPTALPPQTHTTPSAPAPALEAAQKPAPPVNPAPEAAKPVAATPAAAPGPAVPLPTIAALQNFLGSLVSQKVEVSAGAPWNHEGSEFCAVALYARNDGTVAAACVADIAFASSFSAALTMLPIGVVQEAREKGQLTPALLENFREIFNVGANLFQGANLPHLVLQQVCLTVASLPPGAARILTGPNQRLDVTVSAESYGSGKLAMLLA